MSATARHEHLVDGTAVLSAPIESDEALLDDEQSAPEGTEYATRGARRSTRPNLRMVSPLRPERASRGVFALVVVGMLILGMIVILVIGMVVDIAFNYADRGLRKRRGLIADQ